jgi:hypothetical protein
MLAISHHRLGHAWAILPACLLPLAFVAAAPATATPLRILALHGWQIRGSSLRENAHVRGANGHVQRKPGPRMLNGVTATGQRATSDRPGHQQPNLLERAGIDATPLDRLVDDRPLAEDDPQALLKLLYEIQRLDVAFVSRWAHDDGPWRALERSPDQCRGQAYRLTGRVVQAALVKVPAEWVERFELSHYYRCQVRCADGGQVATVVTVRIPRAWPVDQPIDQRVSATALFLKRSTVDTDQRQPVFAARRLAWHPDRIDSRLGVNLGMTVLGDLGVDVGLWDDVETRRPLTARDRELFFQVLDAVEQTGTRQLVRLAMQNLATRVPQWEARERELSRQLNRAKLPAEHAAGEPAPQRADRAAQEALERELAAVQQQLDRARDESFSIVPLFNEPDRQHGELVVLNGTARRAIKIYVSSPDGQTGMPDIWQRFGIDHYYEIEMFTDDSQNNPLVFCVRHLPRGFVEGTHIDQPIRIAGFFIKSWAYRTPTDPVASDGSEKDPEKRWQLAPLLIGRQPLRLVPPPADHASYGGLLAGGLFVLVLLAVWYGIGRWARGDRRFEAQARALRDPAETDISFENLSTQDPRTANPDPLSDDC